MTRNARLAAGALAEEPLYDAVLERMKTHDNQPSAGFQKTLVGGESLVQLAKLASGNKRRADLTARYRSRLQGLPVRIPFESPPAGAESAFHILPLLLPERCDRLEVIEKLKASGVQSSIHYPPFWGFTGYRGMFDPKDTPVVAEIVDRELTLPLYPSMSDEQVDYVADALRAALA